MIPTNKNNTTTKLPDFRHFQRSKILKSFKFNKNGNFYNRKNSFFKLKNLI